MSDNLLKALLTEKFQIAGIPLAADLLQAFVRYAEMLIDWNTRINLTAITDPEGIVIRHFLDSLTILPMVDREQARIGAHQLSLVDVGTGAGFPGLPVRMVRPELSLTLLDSLQKRVKFLDAVIGELSLDQVTTVQSRAEDAGCDKRYREQFDIATARAVASLPVLAEYVLPFVRVGGLMIAMKGQKQDEIGEAANALRILGGQIESLDTFLLHDSEMTRTLVQIRKIMPTPSRFPRKAGLPERRPLT